MPLTHSNMLKRKQRELAMLRQQMDNNHKTTVWAMIISAVIISAAVLFQ